jgi:hypothetical protein
VSLERPSERARAAAELFSRFGLDKGAATRQHRIEHFIDTNILLMHNRILPTCCRRKSDAWGADLAGCNFPHTNKS